MFDDDTQVAIHGELIAGVNEGGGVGNAGNTGEATFPGDNGAVNEHATPADLFKGRDQFHHFT